MGVNTSKLLSKQGPAKGSSSVNRPTSHRPFRDLTRKNMKLFVATLFIMAVISADAASLKVKSRKGRTFWPFVAAPPAPLSTLAKLVLAKGALAAGVGAYGLYDWVTRGTNAGFKAGVGVGPANLGAGGEPVSKVDEEIPVVWLTDDEWETQ